VNRLKVSIDRALILYEPNEVEVVTVLNTKLYLENAFFGSDKWRFFIQETSFAVPTEAERNSWLQAIKRHQMLLDTYYLPILSHIDIHNLSQSHLLYNK